MEKIEKALRHGNVVHIFRSGGGLRVVRISNGDDKLVGYGESCNIEEALELAGNDFENGCKKYECVYLTGSGVSSSSLDSFILSGCSVDVKFEEDLFNVELNGWARLEVPKEIVSKCLESSEKVEWVDDRGCKFYCCRSLFPNGEVGYSTRFMSGPIEETSKVWLWETIQTGKAQTLVEAFDCAFKMKAIAK